MTGLSLRRPPDWALSGACVGMAAPDLDPWAAPSADDLAADVRRRLVGMAVDVCARCPVQAACLDDALVTGEAFTVRGGTTPAQRRHLAAATGHARPSAAGVWQHGSPAGYKAHGCRCARCCDAHARDVAAWRQKRRWAATSSGVLVPIRTLDRPAGRGLHRAYPGQLVIAWEGTAA